MSIDKNHFGHFAPDEGAMLCELVTFLAPSDLSTSCYSSFDEP